MKNSGCSNIRQPSFRWEIKIQIFFFHRVALIRRRKNKISQLKISEDIWLNDPKDIALAILNSLLEAFSCQSHPQTPNNTILQFILKLSSEHHPQLISTPNLNELKASLWNIHPFKHPREDSLHAAFYQKKLGLHPSKLLYEFQNIFSTSKIPRTWCKTLTTLIPKMENPCSLNQFRPINLCATHNKILAKILVNCLRPHLQNIISPLQGAFS